MFEHGYRPRTLCFYTVAGPVAGTKNGSFIHGRIGF